MESAGDEWLRQIDPEVVELVVRRGVAGWPGSVLLAPSRFSQ